ncbi:hypothetical protein FRACYDRAFT_251301 [Fragilariopsis cylindrus CCMP1102]|uniref:Uncharacterized protein n=1 Tax=Fragilariopsis cylindrus CCMP1102 TaxID=635003 RepID=A0A1E7EN59_9STRA|nr:hypothetical protein FRACYDRAFT_251301 [Fragilariopsis cylindrus CCMP1102]|eukprot:OEU07246.1 hypothetical protein FRACYDRAFT_251301 [Fragilariopsis cylindrus CCMP1102]
MEEVLSSLRHEGGPALKVLSITFTNDNFNASTQELQEAILANKMSTSGVKIRSLKILNQCSDQEIHRQCFEFYLRCLEGPENKIRDFLYSPTRNNLLLTLVDANRIADAIATNENIRTFTIHEGYIGGLFCKEGTFGCILNAVLKAGVQNLDLRLRLDYGYAAGDVHRPVDMYDKEMEQLGTVLKVNRGLRVICLSSAIISTIGRQHLLESLRDNTTLLELNARIPPYKSDKSGIHLAAGAEEDELVRHETISIQSQIDHHMVLNKKWKRCSDNNNKSNKSIDDDKDDIPLNIYPNLLEKFAKKPLLLYLFLQKKQPRIFTDISDPSRKRRRRCSMRILAKKRRVLEAA